MDKRLFLLDDHNLLGQLFKNYFESKEIAREVLLATSYSSALEIVKEREFNLAIIDIDIGEIQNTGFDIAEAIRILHPNAKIILVSENPFENNLVIFTKRGYNGFLLNSDELHEYLTSIHQVRLGGQYISNAVADYIKNPESIPHHSNGMQMPNRLSPRELEIINHICNGCTNKEIALKTGAECSTVKKHIQHICSKLNLRNRVEISNYAHRNRIIGINSN